MNIRQWVVALLMGAVLGVVGTLFLPGLVRPYLPDSLAGRTVTVRGAVLGKERKPSALLLTVNTAQGAFLADFTRRIEETDLLVGAGDTVEMAIERYQPFLEDPRILRVEKGGPAAPALGSAPTFSAPTATTKANPPAAGRKERRP